MAERIEQVRQAFAAYTTERELGAGGMATVYLAHDGKTAEEAIDSAILRYNRKHGIMPRSDPDFSERVRWLHVRGWVS